MKDIRLVAIVAILALTGVAVAGASYSDAAHDRDDRAYEVDVVFDEPIPLPGEDLEQITVEQNGDPLEEDIDYDVNREDGWIVFHSDGSASSMSPAEVSYSAIVPAELAVTLQGGISTMAMFVVMAVLALAVAVVLASVGRMRRGI